MCNHGHTPISFRKKIKTSEIKNKVISEIKKIYDPEIPVNIYELGLIYKIRSMRKTKSLLK